LSQADHAADTRYSLVSKILLALASVASYSLVLRIAEAIEPIETVPDTGLWFPFVAGAIFGAFVLMPYVGADRRTLRIALLCVAGALVYRLAIWFVTGGPLDYDLLVSFVITGAGAAALCALAVTLIAPQPVQTLAVVFALVAGAIGGATFDIKIAADPNMVVGHGIWQLLVCLALHAGFGRQLPA
jgi:hypothetical protein